MAVVAGTPLIRDRAVLIADGVPMGGQEFLTITSGFPGAQSLMTPSRIGEARPAAGVIRSRWWCRRREPNRACCDGLLAYSVTAVRTQERSTFSTKDPSPRGGNLSGDAY